MPGLSELYVLIPYSQLEALLSASRELETLREEVKHCNEQLDAVRQIQTETMQKYLDLYKML